MNALPDASPPLQLCPPVARWITENAERRALGDFLVGLARDYPRLFKGFKLSPEAIHKAPLRQRFAVLLTQDAHLAAVLLSECPGPWQDSAALLERWPSDVVHDLWRPLTRLRQTPLVPAAMTQLSEPALAARGRRALQRINLWERESPLPLPERDRRALAPLQRLVAESTATPQAVPHKPNPPASPATEKQRSKVDKERDKLRQQLQSLREESTKKQQALDEKLRLARKQAEEQAKALHSLQADQEGEILRRLQHYRQEVLGIFPPPRPQTTSASPSAREHSPLLKRADRLLDEQARLDEKHGTRARMQNQLKETGERLQKLEAAASNSLAPHPELGHLRSLLETHAQALEEALGTEEIDAPEPARSFLKSIHAVPADGNAAAALQAILDTLEKPFLRSTLGPVWLRELRIAAEKRREYCALIEKERVAARAALPPKLKEADRGPRELFDLAGELQRTQKEKLQIFIDGYNVLLGATGSGPKDLAKERRRFEKLCRRHLGDIKLVELVYDGQDSVETRDRQGNVLRCFAPRRQQDQNADNWLVAQLDMAAEEDGLRWLVTSDSGLRARAAHFCDAFVASDAFLRFLAMS